MLFARITVPQEILSISRSTNGILVYFRGGTGTDESEGEPALSAHLPADFLARPRTRLSTHSGKKRGILAILLLSELGALDHPLPAELADKVGSRWYDFGPITPLSCQDSLKAASSEDDSNFCLLFFPVTAPKFYEPLVKKLYRTVPKVQNVTRLKMAIESLSLICTTKVVLYLV
jgi:hypothetical protein